MTQEPSEKDRKPTPKKVPDLRGSIMRELKDSMSSHMTGTYLEEPNNEEVKTRSIEKQIRAEELREVERVLKKQSK